MAFKDVWEILEASRCHFSDGFHFEHDWPQVCSGGSYILLKIRKDHTTSPTVVAHKPYMCLQWPTWRAGSSSLTHVLNHPGWTHTALNFRQVHFFNYQEGFVLRCRIIAGCTGFLDNPRSVADLVTSARHTGKRRTSAIRNAIAFSCSLYLTEGNQRRSGVRIQLFLISCGSFRKCCFCHVKSACAPLALYS